MSAEVLNLNFATIPRVVTSKTMMHKLHLSGVVFLTLNHILFARITYSYRIHNKLILKKANNILTDKTKANLISFRGKQDFFHW